MAKPPARCLTTGSTATQPADSQMPLNSSLENHCKVFHPKMGWHFFFISISDLFGNFFLPFCNTLFSWHLVAAEPFTKTDPQLHETNPTTVRSCILHGKVLCFPLSGPHSAGRRQPRQGMLWCCTHLFSKGPVCTVSNTFIQSHKELYAAKNYRAWASNWWLLRGDLGFPPPHQDLTYWNWIMTLRLPGTVISHSQCDARDQILLFGSQGKQPNT